MPYFVLFFCSFFPHKFINLKKEEAANQHKSQDNMRTYNTCVCARATSLEGGVWREGQGDGEGGRGGKEGGAEGPLTQIRVRMNSEGCVVDTRSVTKCALAGGERVSNLPPVG